MDKVEPPPAGPSSEGEDPAGGDTPPPARDSSRKQPKRTVWSVCKATLLFVLSQWFIIGIGVVIALAYAWPNVGRRHGVVHTEWSVKYLLIAIIFFVSGLSLPILGLVTMMNFFTSNGVKTEPKNSIKKYRQALDWRLHIVTQVTNFLLFPTLVFAIVVCVKAGDPDFKVFDRFVLVGMLVMAVMPTTVSSNVVMTGQAGGDQAAATVEVLIGNLLGTFITPALLQMYSSTPGWTFAQPLASGPGGTTEIYRQVSEQLGFSVFLPLFVGEVIQYLWPKPVKYAITTLKLSKVGSVALLGVVWSTFSEAFYEGAFKALTPSAIIFILFVNIGVYLFLSLFLFLVARHLVLPRILRSGKKSEEKDEKALFDKKRTVALLFCGAAKGLALGAPIAQILYGGLLPTQAAIVQLPLVLYQGSQVLLGQITVFILKKWVEGDARRGQTQGEGTLVEQGGERGKEGPC
ncbi:hypothetical protein T439DRAFT_330155 [Meredithblackwellia eburnea MCA 4105]